MKLGGDTGGGGDALADVTLECAPAASGDLVMTEILADPPAGADYDGDGTPSSRGDEFVEVVNIAAHPVALTQVSVTVNGKAFGLGARCLAPNGAYVAFGSAGLPQLANSAGTVALTVAGTVVQTHTYATEADRDSSLTLASQLDPASSWVVHKTAYGTAASPGTCGNGNAFPDCEGAGPQSDVAGGDGTLGDGAQGDGFGGCSTQPVVGDLVLNEVLPKPTGGSGGDANGDGVVNSDDEFIEIVNLSSNTLSLDGLEIFDSGSNAVAVPAGICLAPNQVLLVFSKYTGAKEFEGSVVIGTKSLSLNDSGDSVIVKSGDGTVLAEMSYASAPAGESFVREHDLDPTSAWVRHSVAPGAAGAKMSPGTCQGGMAFPECRVDLGLPDTTDGETSGGDTAGGDTTEGDTGPGCGRAPVAGDFVLNEVLFDPTGIDANLDGTVSTSEDEFVEWIVVATESIDLSGLKLGDLQEEKRYTFPALCVSPGDVLVVFGKGAKHFSAGGVAVLDEAAHTLSLNNSPPEAVRLTTAAGVEIARVDFATAALIPAKQSLTRSPDRTGAWVKFKDVNTTGAAASPGQCVDLTAMPACLLTP